MDYRKLANALTERIAGLLYYEDRKHELNMSAATAAQITDLVEGGKARYLRAVSFDNQFDVDAVMFKARVDSVVAAVIQTVRECDTVDLTD